MNEPAPQGEVSLTRDHRRQWRDCLYVYPVISRRARGLSIGVNLNPDKHCTFACVYCQVDRDVRRELHHVDVECIRRELRLALYEAVSGELWREERFASTPEALRRINDIAFSGDGEPTLLPEFDRVVRTAREVRDEQGRPDVKLVVITNATAMDQPQFQRAMPTLMKDNGEIWAKLDAGTEAMFHAINRPFPRVTLRHVLGNIVAVARRMPVVIQTLWLRWEGHSPAAAEVDAYINNVRHILMAGGQIKLIQLHTIARVPACAQASTLPREALDAVAETIRAGLGDVPVETFYG
ncbi:MAG: radical SAM protein [Phycisphaerae bacterium]|nr:radical SAM protein [Phycisphaerae bacterium]